jgi:hypothetical protein
LLYQFGVGLGFLATARSDGHPRVHPICPILCQGLLYGFIVPSPKQRDLSRNGWYSLHSFPCPGNEDAFSTSGVADLVTDAAIRAEVANQFVAERLQSAVAPPADHDLLFEFAVDSCLLTRTQGHGDPAPVHQVWRAQSK